MIKIYSTYKTVNKPWGGANNFLRAVRKELEQNFPVKFLDEPHSCDIIFMNQVSSGPGTENKAITYRDVELMKKKNPQSKIIFRAINMSNMVRNMNLLNYWMSGHKQKDVIIKKIANELAHHTIFQSEYQKNIFYHHGVRPVQSTIIHNGAPNMFLKNYKRPNLSGDEKVRILSISFSGGAHKEHKKIADLSEMKDVELSYIGQWPEDQDSKNIKILGILSHDKIFDFLMNSHYFFHPSSHDMCSNSVIESLCAGVPVIYNQALASSVEIIHGCGIPFCDDLETTIVEAREKYDYLNQTLGQKRHDFSINLTAQKYYDCFKRVLDSTNG